MATSRIIAGINLTTLDTYDAVIEKSKQAQDKLIVVLFHIRHPDHGGIESGMKKCRRTYELNYNVQFYKCVIVTGEQKLKTEFNIQVTPTIVFLRNGQEIGRIDDFDESNPFVEDKTKPGEESVDEKRFKAKLNELCKKN